MKVTYFVQLGQYGELTDFYNPAKIAFKGATPTHVVYVDAQGGEKIVLRGEDLSVNKHGVVTGGIIDEIDFTNKHDAAFMKVTDFEISAKSAVGILQKHGVDGLLDLTLKGNDKFVGSLTADHIYAGAGKDTVDGGAGADHIEGGKGNDRLTGGKASDHFIFNVGDGKDTITDFDAKGGGLAQDYIVAKDHTFDQINIIDAGDNTVIDFGGGDKITLLHVNHTLVTEADFIFG